MESCSLKSSLNDSSQYLRILKERKKQEKERKKQIEEEKKKVEDDQRRVQNESKKKKER